MAQRILASNAENGSRRQIECILSHHSYKDTLERCCNATGIPTTRRIDTKERSRRRSSDLYPREKLLLALLTEGGTIDCLVTWGEKTLCKDGSLEVLVPSRSL